MGFMTEILGSEKKTAPKKKNEPATQNCAWCAGSRFWESIYLDGILRCEVCDPPPVEDMIGRRIGQPVAAPMPEPSAPVTGDELATRIREQLDRMVDVRLPDGRWALALPGWNVPSHANYNPRMCAYADPDRGVERYDVSLGQLQDEWRSQT